MRDLNWISRKLGRSKGVLKLISFSSRVKSKGKLVGVITFSDIFMEKVGWVAGNRIQVARDDDAGTIFMRLHEDGFTLTPYKMILAEASGKPVSCSVVIDGLHFENRKRIFIDEFQVEDGVVSFPIKK